MAQSSTNSLHEARYAIPQDAYIALPIRRIVWVKLFVLCHFRVNLVPMIVGIVLTDVRPYFDHPIDRALLQHSKAVLFPSRSVATQRPAMLNPKRPLGPAPALQPLDYALLFSGLA